MTVIKLGVDGVSVRFGGIHSLSDVSFRVHEGEIYGVLGPNGAGKSSLLNVLSGYYRPSHGRVLLDGGVISGLPPEAIARLGVGRTFQSPSLFAELTVRQNVLAGRHRHGSGGFLRDLLPRFGRVSREARENRQVTDRLLHSFALVGVAEEPVRRLPYGIQKRVDLTRALAAEPSLLLLDEPLAGLAPAERRQLGRLILDFWRESELTIVLVEHDAAFVADVADRVAVFDFGRLIADGEPEAVVRSPEVIRAYLGDFQGLGASI